MTPKPSCFLSCSFQPQDERVAAFFKSVLSGHFDVLTARSEDSIDIYDKIFPKIASTQLFFAIFSRRNRIHGTKKWTAPPDVLIEASFALSRRKTICGFVETDIDEQQQGLLRFSSRNWPRFNRANLEDVMVDSRSYVTAALNAIAPVVTASYEYSHNTKEVTIYKDGYGVIRTQYTIEFNRAVNDILLHHNVSGGRSAKKGHSLPRLRDMIAKGPAVRKKSQYFFATSIVKGGIPDTNLSIVEDHQYPHKAAFGIKILGPFLPSSLLCYELAWGGPDLFPVSLVDLQLGKRTADLEDVESRFLMPPTGRVSNVGFVLRFERPVTFSKEPVFRVYSMTGELLDERTVDKESGIQNSSLYTVYVSKLAVSVPLGRVTAQWRP